MSARRSRDLKGIEIGSFNLTHFLLVDDILLCCDGSRRDATKTKEVFDLYCFAIGMLVITRKSIISFVGIEVARERYFAKLFPY
jgi:hypothetical protein